MADRIGMAYDFGAQAARFGWFYGINALVERETRKLDRYQNQHQRYVPQRPVPGQRALLEDLVGLIRADASAVRDGLIAPSELGPASPGRHFSRLRAMLRDVPQASERRATAQADTVKEHVRESDLPDYYTQDFHYQSGGYLSADSARLYDVQVETLFYGSAQLMRRAGLIAAAQAVDGCDQRKVSLLDVACGTGRLLRDIRRTFPAMKLSGVDLSQSYLDEAAKHLGRLRGANLVQGNAETLPFDDASHDIVTNVFLFHELPPDVRRTVAGELCRVLKPGGTLVFIDSLQMGDRPGWDGLLESFPERFHEPYYRHYTIDDLASVFADAGLDVVETRFAFLSKVVICRKPELS